MAYLDSFNINRPKPPIPELPKTQEELKELLKKKPIRVLKRDKLVSTIGLGYEKGGESAAKVFLQCSLCGMEFTAIEVRNHFKDARMPENCPNCKFPVNVLNALLILQKRAPLAKTPQS